MHDTMMKKGLCNVFIMLSTCGCKGSAFNRASFSFIRRNDMCMYASTHSCICACVCVCVTLCVRARCK